MRWKMPVCERCEAVVGQSVAVEPHEELVLNRVFRRADSVWEMYTCRVCDTHWDRVIPNAPSPYLRWRPRPY